MTSPTGPAAPVADHHGVTVGFDLDMTLIDSRPGIAAVFRALSAETGVFIDADAAVSRLGPPLEQELANWFPASATAEMADRYRALYPDHAITPTVLLPGVPESIEAIRADGGRVLVITSKFAGNAALHLEHCGIVADVLVGWAYQDGKRDALTGNGAHAYVGDFVADMTSARAAGVTAIGVTTGPCGEAELIAAGADVILTDLREFPGWFERSKLFGWATRSR